MYDDAGGDPILHLYQVTQLVEAAKAHALPMNKKEIWCACKRCKNNVVWDRSEMSACWRRVSLITTQSRPNTLKWEQMHKATPNM
jgi:hypothetical protein